MDTRAELQTKLAEAEARLAALPRGDQVRHPHMVVARRTALETCITSLRERLSTAPVHNGLPPVEPTGPVGDDALCLDEQGSRVVHSSPQDNSQQDAAPDLR